MDNRPNFYIYDVSLAELLPPNEHLALSYKLSVPKKGMDIIPCCDWNVKP